MSYPAYLKERANDCIRLAVEGAGSEGIDALIDLAQDYASMAASFEGHDQSAWIDDDDLDADPSPRGWRQLFSWTRH